MTHTQSHDHVLQAIAELVQSQMRDDLKGVDVHTYYLAPVAGADLRGQVGFRWGPRNELEERITHTPGIPIEKLVPDKAWPAAQWIISQIRELQPGWFA